jgi:hypothetical protein
VPQLVTLCRAADLGTLAAVLAERQQRGVPPPQEIASPDPAYIHVSWAAGERLTIQAAGIFVHPTTSRRRG